MIFNTAITRRPGKNYFEGITTSTPGPPDFDLIFTQHENYVSILRDLGLTVEVLEPLSEFPDAYFVEDVAVVTPDVAIITNPGSDSRSGETEFILPSLRPHREVERIIHPGTLDGGDVLMIENHFFIGVSDRTNREGADQLSRILGRHGYTYSLIEISAGLHLKSSVNFVGMKTLLVSEGYTNFPEFTGFNKIVVDPAEEYACNSLWVNDTILIPEGYPLTRRKMHALGLNIIELDVSEPRKMDGGLTCMSLRF